MTTTIGQARRRALYIWLLRGAIGLALLAVAMSTGESLVVFPALLLALIAFRGCPLCWVFGLIDCGFQACASSA
ncbi:MAG TPA: hypothetical protein VH762_14665 [Gemmatimonadaceae bacterium]|jgi:hypothetical protein